MQGLLLSNAFHKLAIWKRGAMRAIYCGSKEWETEGARIGFNRLMTNALVHPTVHLVFHVSKSECVLQYLAMVAGLPARQLHDHTLRLP